MDKSRIIIYAKDIQVLTGKSLRYAQRILQKIRKKLKKTKDHLVTILEFCTFCDYSVEEVLLALNK